MPLPDCDMINDSRPLDPSPPFLGFIAASAGILDEILCDVDRVDDMVNGVNGLQ
jgi:CTP synthase